MRDFRINARRPPGRTPAELARDNAAREQVRAERLERFPVITPENAEEALEWQAARLRELTS